MEAPTPIQLHTPSCASANMCTNAGSSNPTHTPTQTMASTSRLASTPIPVSSSLSANPSQIPSSPASISSSSSISLPHASQLLEHLPPSKASGKPPNRKRKGKEKAREAAIEIIEISDSDSCSPAELPSAPKNRGSASSKEVARKKQKQTASHYSFKPHRKSQSSKVTPGPNQSHIVRPAGLSQPLTPSQSKGKFLSIYSSDSSDIEISGFDAAFAAKPFPFDSEFLKNEKAKKRSGNITTTGTEPANATRRASATSKQQKKTNATLATRVRENAIAGPSRHSSTPAGAAAGSSAETDNQRGVDWYVESAPEGNAVEANDGYLLGGEVDGEQTDQRGQGNGMQVGEGSDDNDDIYLDAPATEPAAVADPIPPAQAVPPEIAAIPAPALKVPPLVPAVPDAQANAQDASEDAYKSATAQILEIVPHADLARVDRLLRVNMPMLGAMTVELVIAALLEDGGDAARVPVFDPAHAPAEVHEAPVPPPVHTPAVVPAVAQAPVPVPAAIPVAPPMPVPPPPAVVPAPAAPPDGAPQPVTPVTINTAMRQVLEVIPDVQRAYLRKLLEINLPTLGERTIELIIGNLIENEGVWPKETNEPVAGHDGAAGDMGAGQGNGQGKEKGRAREDDVEEGGAGEHKRAKIDYTRTDRPHLGGSRYMEYALMALQCSFPRAPKPHLRAQLLNHFGHYAPTHLTLRARERLGNPGYKPKLTASSVANLEVLLGAHQRIEVEKAFWEERAWVQAWDVENQNLHQGKDQAMPTAASANVADVNVMPGMADTGKGKGKRVIDPEPLAEQDAGDEAGIECQCCFGEYEFDKMVQCPEAHLFCSGCLASYAATQLGEHKTALVCMHSSGCAEPFPPTELARALDPKLMELYERLVQSKAITDAGLEGLEECPFCEWKCVLEPQGDETRFWCMNKEKCGVVSCRLCKKSNHLPKTCEEAEKDKHLDGRHAIEEAMTRALMRNCPKCNKPFIKELGCNKMTCPNCQTLSCYICRQVIKGYDHFFQNNPRDPGTSANANGKCLLWDAVEERHTAEVKAAAEKAMQEYKAAHPDANDEEIRVAVEGPRPKTPPSQPVLAVPAYGQVRVGHAGVWDQALAGQIPGFHAMPHERQLDMMRQNMLRRVAMAGGGAQQVHAPGPAYLPAPRPIHQQQQERARFMAQLAELNAAINVDVRPTLDGRHQRQNPQGPGPVHGVVAPHVAPVPFQAPQNARIYAPPRANWQPQALPPMQHEAQLAEMRARVEAQRVLMETRREQAKLQAKARRRG